MSESQAPRSHIRDARRERGWSQNRLSREAGIAPNTVTRIELGQKVRPGSLAAVVRVLGVDTTPVEPAEVKRRDGRRHVIVDIVEQLMESLPEEHVEQVSRELVRAVTQVMVSQRLAAVAQPSGSEDGLVREN